MSAHDFEVAVAAGADIVAHMPGFAPYNAFTPDLENPFFDELRADPARYRVTPAMAEAAAVQGTLVMTTVSGSESVSDDVRHNFEVLQDAGVTLLIGSDRGEFNSVDEATYLVDQNLMSAGDVLQSLSVTTPQALFSDRPIGELSPGHEATFVVLGGNPLEDFSRIRDVERVVKRGETIVMAD
jgi:imidazolonepropionase-like amidohydrolase